ncbi:lyase family protein [Cochlodiniinecator piscidefendens]|uniref:lyase family protein n=1 Tax=Cochlodiniinecator piscidefendens TaxID=2715756 RepID=UPI00140D672D|nr:lyase family protein [Cochlodiniinecator piscidefendens]
MLEWPLMKNSYSSVEMRGIWSESSTVSAWIKVEQALARVQADAGVLPDKAAVAIEGFRVADLDQDRLHNSMELVGRPIVGLVDQMREHVGDEHAPYVHYKSTTQDILDTALAMQMKFGLSVVMDDTRKLITALSDHISAHPSTLVLGRTNGQHAVPMLLRTKLEVWQAELTRRMAVAKEAGIRGALVQVGGPLGDLSNYEVKCDVVKAGMSKALGLGRVDPHWQNARDGVADVVGALGALCATLCKIAHNINLLSSSDIGEVYELHENGKGASSSMHHKRNQRASEFADAVARLGPQRSEQIGELTLHQHERSGGVWVAEWLVVPEVFLLTSGALVWSNKMLADLTIDTDRMEQNRRPSA